ncbi:MAG: F0F1 ATP synthase subunit gamma [Rhodospirillaceae bacterium]|nr:F0F1 ATP synthase subunit gamma [Rhodospirillaceae bacterium]
MQTIDTLRRRIDTVEDLQSIVRTMKSLAAVSIRQYEEASEALADYTRTVELGLLALLRQGGAPRPGPTGRASVTRAYVLFGSDHGLCGRFNEVVLERFAEAESSHEDTPLVLAVGARAASALEAAAHRVTGLELPGGADGLTGLAQSILLTIDDWQTTHGPLTVDLVHNHRTAGIVADPRVARLLPVDLDRFRGKEAARWPTRCLPLWTMETETLLASLVRQYLFVSIFQAGAESLASEHASRLSAMQAAERNIEEHLDEMQGEYRQRRQQAITEELLDVVSGFETLSRAEA